MIKDLNDKTYSPEMAAKELLKVCLYSIDYDCLIDYIFIVDNTDRRAEILSEFRKIMNNILVDE